MTLNLSKGDRVNLSKESGGATKFAVGLSWDTPPTGSTGASWDCDVSAFGLAYDASGNAVLVDQGFVVFYNQPQSSDGAIVHSGDNKTGAGAGDDETILIDTGKLDPRVEEISIIITLHEAVQRGQTFGQVKRPAIRIYDPSTGVEHMSYELDEDFSKAIAVQFGSVYKKNGDWRFNAIGQGFSDKTLSDFVTFYGPNVQVSGG